jgi:aspartate racemase
MVNCFLMQALARSTDHPAAGVPGGMGPHATVDLLNKLLSVTAASCDQDHLPVIVYSLPQIPDRSAAILAGGPSLS